jgi:HK97 family phage major capsid protein
MAGNYTALTDRTDATALIPVEIANTILSTLEQKSAALQLCRKQRMSSKTLTQPVLDGLAAAYWVNGDSGMKQTTEMAFRGVNLVAEEMATILPIPEAVLDDSGFPLWQEAMPLLVEAMGRLLDQAIFAGTGKPASWPGAIIPTAITDGNVQVIGATAAQGGLAADLNSTMALVEADGYDVTGFALDRTMRANLRNARDTTGQKLLDVSLNQIEGMPVEYVGFGVFPPGPTAPPATHAVVGDWNMAVIGIRQDITWKLLDQAVISDDTGKVILNLAQQDAVAMRVVARYGFAVANPITRSGTTTPYPFAVLNSP